MLKIVKKICMYSVFGLFMIGVFNWWLDGFEKPPVEERNILSELIELDDEKLKGLVDRWGEPESVHKNKVYTYEDVIGMYDFLVEGDVKSVTVTIKKGEIVPISEIEDIMGIGDVIEEDSNVFKTDEVERRVVYNVDKIAKIEIESNPGSDVVSKIKITY